MAELRVKTNAYSVEILGNQDQLKRLRGAIDKALETGVGHIPFPEGFHVQSRVVSGKSSALKVIERGHGG